MSKISSVLAAFLLAGSFSALSAKIFSYEHKNSEVISVDLKKVEIEEFANLVYSQPSVYGYKNKALTMDILKPAGKKGEIQKLPVVIFVPGGGFISANKAKWLQAKLAIAEAGYVVASISYRAAPEVKFPDPVIDVKTAIRFLRANAQRFGVDVDRIGVMGNSAGGYFAAMTGVTNGLEEFEKNEHLGVRSDVKAVVDIYGLSDLNKIGVGYEKALEDEHYSPASPESILLNGLATNSRTSGSIKDYPERADKANPLKYIGKNTVPFLIMVGDKDTRVSPNQSEIMHEGLLKAGASSKLIIVKDAEHGGVHWSQKEISDIIIKFLDENVKK